jgi:hypothetical protein
MKIRQALSFKPPEQTALRRLLYSGWVFAGAGLVAGALIILFLWQYSPVIALLCIPMAASVLTALALMFALPVKNRRQRLR